MLTATWLMVEMQGEREHPGKSNEGGVLVYMFIIIREVNDVVNSTTIVIQVDGR